VRGFMEGDIIKPPAGHAEVVKNLDINARSPSKTARTDHHNIGAGSSFGKLGEAAKERITHGAGGGKSNNNLREEMKRRKEAA